MDPDSDSNEQNGLQIFGDKKNHSQFELCIPHHRGKILNSRQPFAILVQAKLVLAHKRLFAGILQ